MRFTLYTLACSGDILNAAVWIGEFCLFESELTRLSLAGEYLLEMISFDALWMYDTA